MLSPIQTGSWSVGMPIPSKRTLMKEMEVSRIALREVLSRLRSLGVLAMGHGRKSIVRTVGTELLTRILPLVVSLETTSSYRQIFEIRLAIESPSAALASLRRTPEDLELLHMHADQCAHDVGAEAGANHYPKTDFEFHLQIARSTPNPLFTVLLNVISRYLIAVQEQSFGSGVAIAWDRAKRAHCATLEAIRDRNPDRARVEMETHPRYTSTLIPKAGTV